MNQIEQIAKRVLDTISKDSSGQEKAKYDCDICKDGEWILDPIANSAKPCTCRESRTYRKILESSGITEAFLERNFNNFIVQSTESKTAKGAAIDYTKRFDEIRKTKGNSIALLGQVGSGKTHLSIAIANELMKRNIGVRYMQYREDITRVKQVANDEISYANEINKYKSATVLLIDDLYKKSTFRNRMGHEILNDADARAMFEIINYRYFNNAPIIVSSEYFMSDILEFDEGIGSRIIEMCKGHILEIRGIENNYRLNRKAL